MKTVIENNIKWLVLAFFFGLTAVVGSSHGQDAPDVSQGYEPEQHAVIQKSYNTADLGSAVVKTVVDEVSSVIGQLESNKTIESAGDSILYMLFAIIMAWSLLKAMMGNGFNQFVEEMIVVFLYWGIVYAFLHAGGIQAIKQFVDSVASAFVGKDMSTLSGALKSTVETGFDAITSIVSMPDLQTRLMETMSAGEKEEFESNTGEIPLMILSFVNIVSKLVTGFIVAIALVTYCANILISFASIAIAVALAPIMVPFYILPSARFLFDGWLRFFLGAAFIKVVGAFFLRFTDELMRSMLTVANNLYLPKNTDFMTLLNGNFMLGICSIILAMLSAHVMAMAPGIASGLFSGSSVSAGFAGMSKAIGGMGANSVNPKVYRPGATKIVKQEEPSKSKPEWAVVTPLNQRDNAKPKYQMNIDQKLPSVPSSSARSQLVIENMPRSK